MGTELSTPLEASFTDLDNLESQVSHQFFVEYALKAQRYLDRPEFEGTPLTGSMLTLGAQRAFMATGRIVPLELALVQAQFESGMGRFGRSPLTNPFNVGEFDSGSTQNFGSTQAGVNAYFKLITKDYLRSRNTSQLLDNFINFEGNRYASNPAYEKGLRRQVKFIKGFLSDAN